MAGTGDNSSLQRHVSVPIGGMDMDSGISQLPQGKVSYCLNGTLEGSEDLQKVYYQNEGGNELRDTLPSTLQVIGKRTIVEIGKCIMLCYSATGKHEIGYFDFKDQKYYTLTIGSCLNFDRDHPINKIEYEINGDAIRIYWADDYNPNRYLDIERLAFKQEKGEDCEVNISTELDCNRLKVQPDFSIPFVTIEEVTSGGTLVEGTYQFGIQYSDSIGTVYTSVYNMSNPVPIFKSYISQDFNLPTGKAISIKVHNLDTEIYQYFNLIVAKSINNITSFELVGTYPTDQGEKDILYTGGETSINLSSDDVFQKFPVYDKSKGVTQADKVIIWNGVTESKRVNYQEIASKIKVGWVKYKLPYNLLYDNPEISSNYRGYMGDEVYAFEFEPILRSGKQCDGFHIPGREAIDYDKELVKNPLSGSDLCSDEETSVERWKIYNTSSVVNSSPLEDNNDDGGDKNSYLQTLSTLDKNIDLLEEERDETAKKLNDQYNKINGFLDNPSFLDRFGLDIMSQVNTLRAEIYNDPIDTSIFPPDMLDMVEDLQSYKDELKSLDFQLEGLYAQRAEVYGEINRSGLKDSLCSPVVDSYGKFGYYESEELYPCNEDIWGDLAGKPIRHHKFPKRDIHDDKGNIYPLGIRVDIYSIKEAIQNSSLSQEEKDDIVGFKILRANRVNNKSVIAKGLIKNLGIYTRDKETYLYPNYPYNDVRPDPLLSIKQTKDDSGTNPSYKLNGFSSLDSKSRFTFHSPDTSFFQPFLGDYIQLESVEYGQSRGHYIPVKDHPKYQIPSRASYAVCIAITMGLIAAGSKEGTGFFGIDLFGGAQTNWNEGLTVLLESLDIINKSIPHKDLAYQYNSVGDYDKSLPIPEDTQSIYPLSTSSRYINDGLADVNDIYKLNNFLRESAVYLRTLLPIKYTHEIYPDVQDTSRWIPGDNECTSSIRSENISSYYISLKRQMKSQYGQIYSYETIDTGYYYDLKNDTSTSADVFGGDTYINRFSFKTKVPFFTQNLVGRQDNLGLDFRNYGNVAYPTYWLSNERDGKFTWGDLLQEAASILEGAAAGGLGSMSIGGAVRGAVAGAILGGIGVLLDNWQNNFDCAGKKFFYQDGKFYLFSYGIPYFYAESEVNVDYRQSYNTKEGDFYKGGIIPDDWLQEVNVPIVNDNSYWYNKTFSKQNKENYFSHLPSDFDPDRKLTHTNRAIYSEKQSSETNYKVNKWLIYRPVSYYDFPQTNGRLISLDRIENNAILARFENKSELYNAMLRIDTSNPQAAYLGNSTLFSSAPPIDYSDTDTGYMGTKHTFLLKTEYGDISVDCERGSVFLIAGQKAKDISGGISKFLNKYLPFQIKKLFPDLNIDNAFNGIGLTGTYDPSLKRVIITKLDYNPLLSGISYKNGQFVYNNNHIDLNDPTYFENYSFTVSFDLAKQVPISFHSYFPNYYIQHTNSFYSNSANGIWEHPSNPIIFNSFYRELHPYVIEHPFSYKYRDEILQSIQDNTRFLIFNNPEDPNDFIEVDDKYFDEAILYSNQQCSGILKLNTRPVGNMQSYTKYPIYNTDSKTILYSKKNHFYQYNTFWSLIKDKSKPLFSRGENLSVIKEINNENMDYSKRSFKKEPLNTKDLRVRHTLNTSNKYKAISEFAVIQTQQSYK